ncbi:hypothetical protein [Ensifer canadensis]
MKPLRERIDFSDAKRGSGTAPHNDFRTAFVSGPLILITATPAGNAPLESAYIVSTDGIVSPEIQREFLLYARLRRKQVPAGEAASY